MKTFLEQNGYKMWKEKTDYIGDKKFVSRKYQKRVDLLPEWKGVTLCFCNDKLFLNIEESKITEFPESYSISIVHENRYGEWCDFKIYSLTEEQIKEFLGQYESKIKQLWEVFSGSNQSPDIKFSRIKKVVK